MAWLQALDVSLFRFVNDTLSHPLLDTVMVSFSANRFFNPVSWLVGIVLLWRWRGRGVLFLVLLGLTIAVTDGWLCNTLQEAISRPRPCITLPDVNLLVGCSRRGSLPSAHAANWFAGATVAFLFWRRSWRIMLPLAVGVSFSRVYCGVHYPSDVVVAAGLGVGSALATVAAANVGWRLVGQRWFPLWYERLPWLPGTPSPAQSPARTESTASSQDRHWLWAGYALLVLFTFARWFYLAGGTIELSEDEAYQWVWSKHLALSYYSKPPLIAYTQWLGTSIWSDTAFGVRFFSPLIAAIIGFLLLRFFAREVNARAGFFLILIVTATPLLSLGAILLTVDPLAVLFWTAAMLSGWRAVQDNSRLSAWLWTGLWMGLGFLSKYSSPLQWMCWAVFFALWPPARAHLRRPGPYLALAVNLLCTLPVIIWNWQHQWITVKHVAGHAGAGKSWWPTLKYIFDFLGAELGLLNPVFLVAALLALGLMWRVPRRDARLVYFFSMGAPVFLLYTLLALKSRVHPNWIAPAVLPMLMVMVIYWEQRGRERPGLIRPWLTAGLICGLLTGILMHDTRLVGKLVGQPLPARLDPHRRVRGYTITARVVDEARQNLAREGKPVFIIGAHYGITSLLTFYTPEAKAQVRNAPFVYCRPSEFPRNQYYFWPGYIPTEKGNNALFVRERDLPKPMTGWFLKWLKDEPLPADEPAATDAPPEWLAQQFESVTPTGVHPIRYRNRVLRQIEIFECRNLR